ncbi:MAG: hypothetical protein HOV73_25920 [Streptomyces sp.]|nr:hypothetical protein [Streptomyces sp.]NUR43524.1 hypothetical protein [Streptomyces sp.]NUS15218.1 hypothetical protein [Streptomyces sp.]NUS25558.1 hypothetical protein [Streptomyces sp.]NUS77351.1 hypothetical protein [Streptomyces sp.]
MRRATHALWLMYGSLAVGLLGAALLCHQRDNVPGTAFFAACAVALAMAIPHTSWLLDEYRAALVAVDRGSLPGQLKTRQDITVEQALAAACCEQWWTTAGAAHQCTRKDQTL